jgi:hypothetical protein
MFRTYLPGVILKNILDVLDRGFQVLKAGGLLVLKFILEFGSKLSIAYRRKVDTVSIIRLKQSFWALDGSKSRSKACRITKKLSEVGSGAVSG